MRHYTCGYAICTRRPQQSCKQRKLGEGLTARLAGPGKSRKDSGLKLVDRSTRESRIRARLLDEVGRIDKQAPFTVALTYPSPYGAAMSSLGYQRIYRAIMESSGMACERVVLDDEAENDLAAQARPVSYESLRPLEEFPVVAASIAYEIEIGGLVRMLDAAAIPPLRAERDRAGTRSSSPAARSRSRTRSRSRRSATRSSSARPR